MKDALDDAKANPEKVTYATAGIAGPAQLATEDLALRAGVKLLHVPFPGDAPAVASILAGDVAIGAVSAASSVPNVLGGKLKALAVGGPERMKALPQIATAAEQTGFKDFAGYAWNILMVPKGTPPDIIATLNKAVNEIIARPDVQQKLEAQGLRALGGDVAFAQAFIAAEIAKNKRIIETTGIKRE
jgi:tripartite-type tricarboxylate transporter receptor subunit TctC